MYRKIVTSSKMGLSRRIKFKLKFSRKYEQDVYGFFAKKQISKDVFINKVSASLLRTEKVGLQKKFFFLLQETEKRAYEKLIFSTRCLFFFNKSLLYTIKLLIAFLIRLRVRLFTDVRKSRIENRYYRTRLVRKQKRLVRKKKKSLLVRSKVGYFLWLEVSLIKKISNLCRELLRINSIIFMQRGFSKFPKSLQIDLQTFKRQRYLYTSAPELEKDKRGFMNYKKAGGSPENRQRNYGRSYNKSRRDTVAKSNFRGNFKAVTMPKVKEKQNEIGAGGLAKVSIKDIMKRSLRRQYGSSTVVKKKKKKLKLLEERLKKLLLSMKAYKLFQERPPERYFKEMSMKHQPTELIAKFNKLFVRCWTRRTSKYFMPRRILSKFFEDTTDDRLLQAEYMLHNRRIKSSKVFQYNSIRYFPFSTVLFADFVLYNRTKGNGLFIRSCTRKPLQKTLRTYTIKVKQVAQRQFDYFFFTNSFLRSKKLKLRFLKKTYRKSLYMREAKYFANIFVRLLKYIFLHAFVRDKFFQDYVELWRIMLDLVSSSLKPFLKLIFFSNPEFYKIKQKEAGLPTFSFMDKVRLSKFNIKAPRFFEFLMAKLKRKYGFSVVHLPFRLDIKNTRVKHTKESEKLMLYRLLKVTRRVLGNLTQKRIWKARKMSTTRTYGYTFFNALLLFESRLDIFLVRAHFCKDLTEARGLIHHGVILVNGRKIFDYNYSVSLMDIVSVINPQNFKLFLINRMLNSMYTVNSIHEKIFPSYLEINFLKVTVSYIPRLFDISKIPSKNEIVKQLVLNWGKFFY